MLMCERERHALFYAFLQLDDERDKELFSARGSLIFSPYLCSVGISGN